MDEALHVNPNLSSWRYITDPSFLLYRKLDNLAIQRDHGRDDPAPVTPEKRSRGRPRALEQAKVEAKILSDDAVDFRSSLSFFDVFLVRMLMTDLAKWIIQHNPSFQFWESSDAFLADLSEDFVRRTRPDANIDELRALVQRTIEGVGSNGEGSNVLISLSFKVLITSLNVSCPL